MKKTEISYKTGIYDTSMVLRDYGTKITVQYGYVRWVGQTGVLVKRSQTLVAADDMVVGRKIIAAEELVTPDNYTPADMHLAFWR